MVREDFLIVLAIFIAPEANHCLHISRVILQFLVKVAFDTKREADSLLTKVDDVFRVENALLQNR